MRPPIRDISLGPSAIHPPPSSAATGLPATFGLEVDASTIALDDGAVLLGGSPLRLLRLSSRGQGLVDAWRSGGLVGDRSPAQQLARRLVAAGAFHPVPTTPRCSRDDVTVVIPVRDRPDQLRQLLTAVQGLACVVVDDASVDPDQTGAIALEFGAHCVRLPANVGPSGARNAGLAAATSPLVAFIDSDCRPTDGWLEPLLGLFDDPLVGAVAPRVVAAAAAEPTWLTRYQSLRSSLDMGPEGGSVRPMSRLSYVPSAALVVRRDLADWCLFDPRLRGGEDVDLVWRLADAGWDVRYAPTSVVHHEGPDGLWPLLARRFFYGTTAAPLSARHPEHLAPLSTSAWSAAVWLMLVGRRPVAAGALLAASILELTRRLDGKVTDPLGLATRIAGGGTARSALPALAGLTRAWAPAALVALGRRRSRTLAVLALLVPAFDDWRTSTRALDLGRYSALHVADDLAYGCGVWAGCLRGRTARPLRPRIAWRARTWSASALTTQVGQPTPGTAGAA